MQEDKRRIDVQALLLSAQPVSTLQLISPFNYITGLAIIAVLCVIILFITVFIVLQVGGCFIKNPIDFFFIFIEKQYSGNAARLQQGINKEAKSDM